MRPRRIVLLVAALLTGGIAAATAQDTSRDRLVTRLLAAVNQQRAMNGVGPVRLDPRLAAAAQRHAEDMVRRDYLDHKSSDGRGMQDRAVSAGYPWRVLAENLSAGIPSPESAVRSWMTSPGHRDNLLGDQFVHAGIGVAEPDPEGRRPTYSHYWVLMLGAPAR